MKPSAVSFPQSKEDDKKEFSLHGSLALFGAFTGFFCTVGFFNSFGLFESYYKTHQLVHESQSTISWLGAVSTFLLYAGSIVCGILLDTFGARIMIYLGAFGTILSVMMVSLCEKFWEFMLSQGILFGISMALAYTPVLGVIGQYFKCRRAAALGIVISGSSLGGVIWPIMLQRLIYNPNVGFAWALRIVGFMMLPLLGLTCVLVRPPKKSPACDCDMAAGDRRLHECDCNLFTSNQESKGAREKPSIAVSSAHLRKPEAVLTCSAFFVIYFGMFTPLFFTASFARAKHFSEDLSFYTISIMNAASLVGRVVPGFLADSYGRFNTCVLVTMSSGIIAFCWSTVSSLAGLVIFSLAYGFSSGAILSLQQACAAQISTPKTIGRTMGIVMASASLSYVVFIENHLVHLRAKISNSGLAGIPISGQISEKYGYLALSMYAGASLILGSTLLAAARFKQQSHLWAVV
ncbi:MFS monocarboxylate transporter [Penicillium argentinense]|uniref:MFS monocarboxylate transporter n=1 Tax=Penicillium argentinense TaxID=1131581 RepID=A0A9W9ENZ6_9EURO|nr:MFS monocarboxylate transporter [Penicillium argentinense]KAJ5085338.1 MFS monocarboxylate transporter [Penicillium argentinense]